MGVLSTTGGTLGGGVALESLLIRSKTAVQISKLGAPLMTSATSGR